MSNLTLESGPDFAMRFALILRNCDDKSARRQIEKEILPELPNTSTQDLSTVGSWLMLATIKEEHSPLHSWKAALWLRVCFASFFANDNKKRMRLKSFPEQSKLILNGIFHMEKEPEQWYVENAFRGAMVFICVHTDFAFAPMGMLIEFCQLACDKFSYEPQLKCLTDSCDSVGYLSKWLQALADENQQEGIVYADDAARIKKLMALPFFPYWRVAIARVDGQDSCFQVASDGDKEVFYPNAVDRLLRFEILTNVSVECETDRRNVHKKAVAKTLSELYAQRRRATTHTPTEVNTLFQRNARHSVLNDGPDDGGVVLRMLQAGLYVYTATGRSSHLVQPSVALKLVDDPELKEPAERTVICCMKAGSHMDVAKSQDHIVELNEKVLAGERPPVDKLVSMLGMMQSYLQEVAKDKSSERNDFFRSLTLPFVGTVQQPAFRCTIRALLSSCAFRAMEPIESLSEQTGAALASKFLVEMDKQAPKMLQQAYVHKTDMLVMHLAEELVFSSALLAQKEETQQESLDSSVFALIFQRIDHIFDDALLQLNKEALNFVSKNIYTFVSTSGHKGDTYMFKPSKVCVICPDGSTDLIQGYTDMPKDCFLFHKLWRYRICSKTRVDLMEAKFILHNLYENMFDPEDDVVCVLGAIARVLMGVFKHGSNASGDAIAPDLDKFLYETCSNYFTYEKDDPFRDANLNRFHIVHALFVVAGTTCPLLLFDDSCLKNERDREHAERVRAPARAMEQEREAKRKAEREAERETERRKVEQERRESDATKKAAAAAKKARRKERKREQREAAKKVEESTEKVEEVEYEEVNEEEVTSETVLAPPVDLLDARSAWETLARNADGAEPPLAPVRVERAEQPPSTTVPRYSMCLFQDLCVNPECKRCHFGRNEVLSFPPRCTRLGCTMAGCKFMHLKEEDYEAFAQMNARQATEYAESIDVCRAVRESAQRERDDAVERAIMKNALQISAYESAREKAFLESWENLQCKLAEEDEAEGGEANTSQDECSICLCPLSNKRMLFPCCGVARACPCVADWQGRPCPFCRAPNAVPIQIVV